MIFHALTADDEDDEEMIEAGPQQEMINIPGLGPMPIRNLPQGMGELHQACSSVMPYAQTPACMLKKSLKILGFPG